MERSVNILLVEDSEFDAELIVYNLQKYGINTSFERVFCEKAMRDALKCRSWDIILSDHLMPCFNSIGALEVRNEISPTTPFIIVSSCFQGDTAKLALERDCNACISKNDLESLGRVIKKLIAI